MVYAKYHIAMLGLGVDMWKHKPIQHIIHGFSPEDVGLRLVRAIKYERKLRPPKSDAGSNGPDDPSEEEPPDRPDETTESEQTKADDWDAVPIELDSKGEPITYWVAARKDKNRKWVGAEAYARAQATAWILNYHLILKLNGKMYGHDIDWAKLRKEEDAKKSAEISAKKRAGRGETEPKAKKKKKKNQIGDEDPTSSNAAANTFIIPNGSRDRRVVRRQYRRQIRIFEAAVKQEASDSMEVKPDSIEHVQQSKVKDQSDAIESAEDTNASGTADAEKPDDSSQVPDPSQATTSIPDSQNPAFAPTQPQTFVQTLPRALPIEDEEKKPPLMDQLPDDEEFVLPRFEDKTLVGDDNESNWSEETADDFEDPDNPPPDYLESAYELPDPRDTSETMQSRYKIASNVWRQIFNKYIWSMGLRAYLIHRADESHLLPLSFYANMSGNETKENCVRAPRISMLYP